MKGRLMRQALGLLVVAFCCMGAAPSRDNTYVAGTVISPDDVMDNEDAMFEYLQNGVDTYAANSITTTPLATGSVTSADILDGTITTTDLAFAISPGNTLPTGAVFFMRTGSCPSWTTNVSATYSNLFPRINATAGSQSGTDTHTHAVGSYVGSAHTHSSPYSGWSTSDATAGADKLTTGKAETERVITTDNTTGSGGGGAITGTSASGSNVPAFVTLIMCQVN